MRILKSRDKKFTRHWRDFLQATATPDPKVVQGVQAILKTVRTRGDQALVRYTRELDRFKCTSRTLRLTPREITEAVSAVPRADLQRLRRAARQVRRFHREQRPQSWRIQDDGARMGLRWTPLQRVGIYVPGGQAAYPSTVLMNAIPAQVAGVAEIVMVTPAPDGKINPYSIAAAHILGITDIFRIGGAQAVAALAYGTKSVPAVDKIVGPGNAYVAAAKQLVFGQVDIDMIAGPTEVLVLCDSRARPAYAASELLSQAEHDPDARPVLVSTSERQLKATVMALTRQLEAARRRQIAAQALRNNGLAVLASSQQEAIRLTNEMAPEHLVILTQAPKSWMKEVRNAGAIFLGPNSPVAAGDYLVGPNHVLPTARTARYASPLGVYDFVKASSWLDLSREGLEYYGEDIRRMARIEGLHAHGESVRIRLEASKK